MKKLFIISVISLLVVSIAHSLGFTPTTVKALSATEFTVDGKAYVLNGLYSPSHKVVCLGVGRQEITQGVRQQASYAADYINTLFREAKEIVIVPKGYTLTFSIKADILIDGIQLFDILEGTEMVSIRDRDWCEYEKQNRSIYGI